MALNMVFDQKTQKWSPAPADSVSGEIPSKEENKTPPTSGTTPSTPKGTSGTSTTSTTTQTNSAGNANKKQAVLEYNTLEGSVVLKASIGVLKVKENTTVELVGVGDFLSGLYYVSQVEYGLDSSGFSMSCTLVKTGFGNSLKSKSTSPAAAEQPAVREDPVPVKDETQSSIAVGDSVKIVGDDAVYSNAHDGVKVPNWVKQKTLTVQKLSKDGTRALLQPIFSWTYLKYIQKV